MKSLLMLVTFALVQVDSAHSSQEEAGHVMQGACGWLVRNITNPNPAQYLPQCDHNGNFLRRQCWGSLDVCWCVEPYSGEALHGTKSYPGQESTDCEEEVEPVFQEKKPCCPEHWTRHDDHCYIFIDSPKCWAEAESYCQFEEGHLASITCPRTNHFLRVLTRGNTYDFPESWVGGTNAVQASLWMWNDGLPFDFQDWSSEACKYRENSCLRINCGYKLHWGSASCNQTLPFVCAKAIEHED